MGKRGKREPIVVNEKKQFHEMTPREKSMAIKMYRIRHDITQQMFADMVGCSVVTIIYLENYESKRTHKTKLETVWKIEDILEKEKNYDC